MSRLSIADVHMLNELLTSSHESLTGVFEGATAGIGFGILQAFAKYIKKPRAIVIGRSEKAFAAKLQKLKQINPAIELTFIEAEVGLLRNVDKACEEIKATVSQINLLFLSAGYINFGSRDENEEGFDQCQALRYHTRLRFTTNLLPLMSAPIARVVSVLAAGWEMDMDLDDLELRKKGAYSVGNAGGYAAAMKSLAFEKLAKENPQVGFIHVYPGFVKTDVISSSLGNGILGFLARWIVSPILGLFTISAEESGERIFCYTTSDKVAGPAVEGQSTMRMAKPSAEGCWLLNEHGQAPKNNEKIMADLRAKDGEKKVWEHTQAEWRRVLG